MGLESERKIKVKLPQWAINALDSLAFKEGRSREKQLRVMLLPLVSSLAPKNCREAARAVVLRGGLK